MMTMDVANWRRELLANTAVSNATKVLLLVLCDDMDRRGYVSVPRSTLARRLGVAPARITERVREAHKVGLLFTVEQGRPGRTATYVATNPVGTHVRTTRRGTHVRTSEVDKQYQARGTHVRTNAHAQLGTHVHSASSNPPTLGDSPTFTGEKRFNSSNSETRLRSAVPA